jgi:putative protein-disulfide isomerase
MKKEPLNMTETNNLCQALRLEVDYYTDPICSDCWALEPIRIRLVAEYGHLITLHTRLGGLMRDWDRFAATRDGIDQPSDIAPLWEELGRQTHMPIDGDIWLEDPLDSSYPPSIAYKAAQEQDPQLAEHFLRRLRELVVAMKQNITRDDVLRRAALEVGLDADRLLEDARDPDTIQRFMEEKTICLDIGVTSLPTLIFRNSEGRALRVPGARPYEHYVFAMEKLLCATPPPRPITLTVEEAVAKHRSLATTELVMLLQRPEADVLAELESLAVAGRVEKVPLKNGAFWRAR